MERYELDSCSNETKDNAMKIGLNRRRVMEGRLYDAQIEYLKSPSDGLAYIDTGFIPNQNTSIEIKFKRDGTISNFLLYGARPSGFLVKEFSTLPYNNGTFNFRFGNKDSQIAGKGITSGNIYTLTSNKNSFTLVNGQGTLITSGTAQNNTFNSGYSMYLFGANIGGNVSRASLTSIYYCKITDGSTLVRDYIPVRVGTIGYMYDKVSKTLFGNADIGDFILGNDI